MKNTSSQINPPQISTLQNQFDSGQKHGITKYRSSFADQIQKNDKMSSLSESMAEKHSQNNDINNVSMADS